PAVPTKTGYTGKWMYNGAEFTSAVAITENITVQAEYTINTYTVTFKAEGSADIIRYADYDTAVADIPAVPTRTGYTNGKWMYNSSEFTTSTKVTDNITVTAEYTALYAVTYVLEADESVVIFTQNDVPDGTVPVAVTLPVVLDTDSDGAYDYYLLEWTQPSDKITGNTTVPVKYELYSSVYQLKITDASGTISTGLALSGTQITLPSADDVTPLDNYTFVGWGYVNSGGYSDSNIKKGAENSTDNVDDYMLNITPDYDPGATITLSSSNRLNGGGYSGLDNYKFFAVYEGNPMTVTFVNEDGGTVATRTAVYGKSVESLPNVPDKTGYTGVWKYGGSEFTTSTKVTGNITVEPVYTINTYTVTFKAEGSADIIRYADYDTAVADIPAVPTRTGYTNGKWMYNSSEFTTSTKVTDNITVTAEYTALYAVTYVLEADESVVIFTQNDVPDGTVPVAVTLPVVLDTDSDGAYDYYLFGWQQPTEAIAGDTTICVAYELYNGVSEVKITDAGGTKQHFLSMAGNEITLPDTAEAMENYEFVGWGAVSSGGYADPSVKEGCTATEDTTSDVITNNDYITIYSPGDTITLTDGMRMGGNFNDYYPPLNNFKFAAVYMGRECTITFKDTSGNTVTTTTARYGDWISFAEFTDEEIEGYNLVWTYNGAELGYNSTVTGDMDIIAAYIPIT
ncbi:MAG: InlB B-repeat-containing protein, partial [Ruminiclostridium sp.]